MSVTDPYRGAQPRMRYEIRVDGESFESDRFEDIVERMRAMGYSYADIVEVALVAIREPRGGRLETNGLRRRS